MVEKQGVQSIEQSLRRHFQPHIFERGQEYFSGKQVISFSMSESEDKEILIIIAEVEGSDTYNVSLEYNSNNEKFGKLEFLYSDLFRNSDFVLRVWALGYVSAASILITCVLALEKGRLSISLMADTTSPSRDR